MKNRARLACTALYDLLFKISNNTDACTIRLVTGQMPNVKRCNAYKTCAACLQKWLDEEEKQNGKAD